MTRTRLGVLVAAGLVALVGLLYGAWYVAGRLWDSSGSSAAPGCTVGAYTLDTGQASVAAQMVGEVTRYRPALPDRAAVLVLAAGLQESRLTNLAPGEGDRDSVGVLQQRPSQGWGGGDANKLNDVTEATREFLKALVSHSDWRTAPLAKAINDVQISIDGSYYTQWQGEANALARALLGRAPRALTCRFGAPTEVAAATRVAGQLRAQLPVSAVRATGKRVVVPGAGWQTVAWFVANADRYGIDSVAHQRWRWSRADGWQRTGPTAADPVATLARV